MIEGASDNPLTTTTLNNGDDEMTNLYNYRKQLTLNSNYNNATRYSVAVIVNNYDNVIWVDLTLDYADNNQTWTGSERKATDADSLAGAANDVLSNLDWLTADDYATVKAAIMDGVVGYIATLNA